MKLSEMLNSNKLSLSFEVFPPKTDSSFDSVRRAVFEIAELKPSFMSVTYGAGGGTSKYTLDIAKDIKESYGVPSLAHLTCVSSSRNTVHEQIRKIKDSGIVNIMALRGDIPDSMKNDDRSSWDYNHAVELIRDIKEYSNDFCIGGACYPEMHPESNDRISDIVCLKEKVDAGCDFLTTQMFFDNNILYSFLYRIREVGITVPIVPGIMPITNGNQIKRAKMLSSSHIPQRFMSMVDKFGNDPAAMLQCGVAYATDQIIDLYANGITNVHVYSMNNPTVAKMIWNNLSDVIGKG